MPKQLSEQELRQIENVVAAAPHGVTISDLEAALAAAGIGMARRALQRRLALLIEAGRIAATGDFRGRLYLPPHPLPVAGTEAPEPPIPLSDAGRQVRAYVIQPIQRREPVGYRRDFLLSYRKDGPYLDAPTLDHLHRIGRAHQEAMPAGTMARQVLGRLLIDLSRASSYLEGNTYSLLDTERLISFGQAAEGKNALETQMILTTSRPSSSWWSPPTRWDSTPTPS